MPLHEPKNRKALETGSGITWDVWVKLLAPHQDLDHSAMAKLVYAEILKVGESKSPEWWAQGVTVAYEQHIGRRQIGQTCAGDFSVTVSKTVPGDMNTALTDWCLVIADEVEFDGVKITTPGKVTQTPKWRYWRCGLEDGSKVSVNIQTKPGGDKSLLAINHDKLSDSESVERWRSFWKHYDAQIVYLK